MHTTIVKRDLLLFYVISDSHLAFLIVCHRTPEQIFTGTKGTEHSNILKT